MKLRKRRFTCGICGFDEKVSAAEIAGHPRVCSAIAEQSIGRMLDEHVAYLRRETL